MTCVHRWRLTIEPFQGEQVRVADMLVRRAFWCTHCGTVQVEHLTGECRQMSPLVLVLLGSGSDEGPS